MYCSCCGKLNESGLKFCSDCGSKLEFASEERVMETFEKGIIVTERVSGEESVYRNLIDNMKEVYEFTGDYNVDEQADYNKGKNKPKNNRFIMGFLSLVFAVIGGLSCGFCFFDCTVYLGMAFEIAALVLGISSLATRERKKGLAIAGLTISTMLLLVSCGALSVFTYENYYWGRNTILDQTSLFIDKAWDLWDVIFWLL